MASDAQQHLGRWAAGFSWGDAGPGSADLARSLLIGALGPAAPCPACHGVASPDTGISGPCLRCDDGYRPVPSRKFTSEVVASLDQDTEWVIDRAMILAWLSGVPANPYADPQHPFWGQYGVQGTEWDDPRA